MTDQENIELLSAQIRPLPELNETEKRDPVRVMLCLYDRFEVFAENLLINKKMVEISYRKADDAYNKACEMATTYASIKKNVSFISKAASWIGGVCVGLAIIYEAFWHKK